jgi:hypothetical protein
MSFISGNRNSSESFVNNLSSSFEGCVENLSGYFYPIFSDADTRIPHLFNRAIEKLVASVNSLLDGSCISSFFNSDNEKKFKVIGKTFVIAIAIHILFGSTLATLAGILCFANETRPVYFNERLSDAQDSVSHFTRRLSHQLDKLASKIPIEKWVVRLPF